MSEEIKRTDASETEEKTEEKNSSTKRKKTTRKKKSAIGKGTRVIWLYGAHDRLINRTAARLLDFGSEDCIRLREQIELGLEDIIIPIYPFPASGRSEAIKQAIQLKGVTILVVGLTTDQKNKAAHKYYKDAELAWSHPAERQFHIDMAPASVKISFSEAEDAIDEWMKFFTSHFKRGDINIIR